jgi:hypothetical protein
MTPAWLPDPRQYRRITRLFLRLLGCIYLAAFLSCLLQMRGLYGADGIIPLVDYLPSLPMEGWRRWAALPTLLWISQSDTALILIPALGIAASLLLVADIARPLALATCWLLYLSLVNAGPVFMQFQWDTLLLETGFLAMLLNVTPALGILLYRWLLFRFMWLSGLVKVLSDDPLWASGSALMVHFETQPLPTVLGWFAHQLPGPILRAGSWATLGIELLLPLLIFAPRRARLVAFWGFVLLEVLILLTGNYNFFTLLTLGLCLFLLEDRDLPWDRRDGEQAPAAQSPTRLRWLGSSMVATMILLASLTQLYLTVGRQPPTAWQRTLLGALQPWHIAHSYGVFAVMTPERPELVIEASNDSLEWQPYRFHFKPGELDRAPGWVAPGQPRLDWQLWFAALREQPPQWLENLLVQLLMGSPAVKNLFAEVPFGGETPAYIRVRRYRYSFTDPQTLKTGGTWWRREFLDTYQTPMRLSLRLEHQPGDEREIPW